MLIHVRHTVSEHLEHCLLGLPAEQFSTRRLLSQVLGKSWEKDEAMAWTAVMALLTHAADAVYKAAEDAEVELAGAGEVEVSGGTSAQAAKKGGLIDTQGAPQVNGQDSIDAHIQDSANKMVEEQDA